MLGLDVHDCAHARDELYRDGHARRPGYVLTVEPGLYFQPDDLLVPEDLRGIGVRIEDDVLITADGLPSTCRRPSRATPTASRPGWRPWAGVARTGAVKEGPGRAPKHHS